MSTVAEERLEFGLEPVPELPVRQEQDALLQGASSVPGVTPLPVKTA